MKFKTILIIICLVLSGNAYTQEKYYHTGELDTLPRYTDSITFTQHVRNKYKFPGQYDNIAAKIIFEFGINKHGHITAIDFYKHDKDLNLCYENILLILKTARKFTPGYKDGKPVYTKIVMSIPYSDSFSSDPRWNINNWTSVFDQDKP